MNQACALHLCRHCKRSPCTHGGVPPHLPKLRAESAAVVPDVQLDRGVLGSQVIEQALGVDTERTPSQ